jgi:hypothetical protein
VASATPGTYAVALEVFREGGSVVVIDFEFQGLDDNKRAAPQRAPLLDDPKRDAA